MPFDQHQQADNEQQRLDALDTRIDAQVGLDPAKARERTDLYMRQVDEIQDRVAALSDSAGDAGTQLENVILSGVVDFLKEVDFENLDQKSEEFSEFLEEQMRLIEGLERQVDIPQEFRNIVGILDYGQEAAADYYTVYRRTPEGLRLEIDEIGIFVEDLDGLLKRLAPLTDAGEVPNRSSILAEAFGFLINGDFERFDDLMNRLDIEEKYQESREAVENNKGLEAELDVLQAKMDRYNRAIAEMMVDVADLQRQNPRYWKSWREHQDDRIAPMLDGIRGMEFQQTRLAQDIQSKQDRIIENNAVIYEFQYRFGVASGAPQGQTDRLLLDMSKSLGDQMPEDLQDEVAEAYERVLSSDDITDFELAYYSDSDAALAIAIAEYNGVSDDENPQTEQQNVMRALENDPALAALRDESRDIYGKFAPISELLHAAMQGNRTFEYVHDVKHRVRELNEVYDPDALRSLIAGAHSSIDALSDLDIGHELSEFEATLLETERAISGFEELVNSGQIEALSDFVLSGGFTEENLMHWMETSGTVIVTSIASGIAVMTVVGAPAGLSGFALIGYNSVLMAAGSVVGAEIGRELSNAMWDTGMKSKIREFSEGTKTGPELLKEYAIEFGFSAASMFMFMSLGKIVASKIGGWANMDMVYISRMAREVQDFVAATRGAFDWFPNSGGALGSYFRELSEEITQEMAEGLAGEIHPALGAIVTFVNSMDGRNVTADASHGISQLSRTVEGHNVHTRYEYSEGMGTSIIQHLRSIYGASNVTSYTNDEGTTIERCTFAADIRGQRYEHVMEFSPTTESVTMRQTLRRSVGPDGNIEDSVLVANYGLTYNESSGGYTYRSLTAPGRIGLIAYLEQDGYVVRPELSGGTFIARKGDEAIRFTPERMIIDEADAQVWEEFWEGGKEPAPDRLDMSLHASVDEPVDVSPDSPEPQGSHPLTDYADRATYKEARDQLKARLDSGELTVEQYRRERRRLHDRVARDRMSRAVEYFEAHMTLDDSRTPEAMVSKLVEDLRAEGIVFLPHQRELMLKAAYRYRHKSRELWMWREEIQHIRNGKRNFLDAIGIGWAEEDHVDIDLSHPIFIGIKFKRLVDAVRASRRGAYIPQDVENFSTKGWIWANPTAFKDNPELNFSIYFVSPLGNEGTAVHEAQHLMFAIAYDAGILSRPPGEYVHGGIRNSFAHYERYALDETLAYLKGGDYRSDARSLLAEYSLGNIIDNITVPIGEGLTPVERLELGTKLAALERFYHDAKTKGIQPQQLWSRCQAAANLDEAMSRLYDQIYSHDEQHALEQEYRSRLSQEEAASFDFSQYEGVGLLVALHKSAHEFQTLQLALSQISVSPYGLSLDEARQRIESYIQDKLSEEERAYIMSYKDPEGSTVDLFDRLVLAKLEIKLRTNFSPGFRDLVHAEWDRGSLSDSQRIDYIQTKLIQYRLWIQQNYDLTRDVFSQEMADELRKITEEKNDYLDEMWHQQNSTLNVLIRKKVQEENPELEALLFSDAPHPLFGDKPPFLPEQKMDLYRLEQRFTNFSPKWKEDHYRSLHEDAEIWPSFNNNEDLNLLEAGNEAAEKLEKNFLDVVSLVEIHVGAAEATALQRDDTYLDERLARAETLLAEHNVNVLQVRSRLSEMEKKLTYFGDDDWAGDKPQGYEELSLGKRFLTTQAVYDKWFPAPKESAPKPITEEIKPEPFDRWDDPVPPGAQLSYDGSQIVYQDPENREMDVVVDLKDGTILKRKRTISDSLTNPRMVPFGNTRTFREFKEDLS